MRCRFYFAETDAHLQEDSSFVKQKHMWNTFVMFHGLLEIREKSVALWGRVELTVCHR